LSIVGAIQWGDFPTWIAAIATAAAFGGTLYLLFMQRGQLDLQQGQLDVLRRQEDDRQYDRLQDQARSIAAWVVKIADSRSEVYLRVRNSSEEPVWNCCVRVKSHWAPSHDLKWVNLQVLPPQETVPVTVRIELPDGLAVNPPAEVTFTDASGRRWRRRDLGALELWPDRERPPESMWPDY
jgi:hypothetical protein